MSEEKKAVAMPQKKDVKKNRKSIGWFIGIAVLILISVVFVLPATAFAGNNGSNAVSFGKYDGKEIQLTYDSYFYYALQSVYNAYAQTYGEDSISYFIYNIYYSAFQNAVVNEQFQKMAKQVGMKPTSKQITDAVVNSGFYSDGQSVYSSERYAAASDMDKAQIVQWMQLSVPFEQVEDDIEAVKISSAERDFIGSMSSEKRSFDYLLIDGSLYPEADALAFAEANPELFSTVSIRRATVSDQELAQAALEELAQGSLTFDQLVEDSIDGSKADDGYMEGVYRFVLENYLDAAGTKDAAEEIYTADTDTLVGPIQTSEGWTLFYITEKAQALDMKRDDLASAVRGYLTLTEPETMHSFVESIASQVYADAQSDWLDAAAKYDITERTVSSVAQNAGDSQFVVSFNYVDVAYDEYLNITDGVFYTAVKENEGWEEKLFKADYGTVLEPVASGSAYIIAKPRQVPATDSSYTISVVTDMYAGNAPEFTVIDYETTILNSDKLEDDFVNGFMKAAYGM